MVLLASIAAVSCTQELTTDADRLPAPKAAAGDITCTSFTVSWDIVTDAGSYTYVFNGGEPETTDKTSVTFTGLQPQTTYSFVLKHNFPGVCFGYTGAGTCGRLYVKDNFQLETGPWSDFL